MAKIKSIYKNACLGAGGNITCRKKICKAINAFFILSESLIASIYSSDHIPSAHFTYKPNGRRKLWLFIPCNRTLIKKPMFFPPRCHNLAAVTLQCQNVKKLSSNTNS